MNFVAIKLPAAPVATGEPRQAPQFLGIGARIPLAGKRFQVIAYELIHARAHRFGTATGLAENLVIDGERYIHEHILRVHGLCVNRVFQGSIVPADR